MNYFTDKKRGKKKNHKDLKEPEKLPWQEIRGGQPCVAAMGERNFKHKCRDLSGGSWCAPNKTNHDSG